jgi:hypothetical protein
MVERGIAECHRRLRKGAKWQSVDFTVANAGHGHCATAWDWHGCSAILTVISDVASKRISAGSSNTRAIRTRGSILVLCRLTLSRREASV